MEVLLRVGQEKGKQIEDGTQRTFSGPATDASEAASLKKRGVTSPAKGLAAPSASATLAAVQEAQARLQIGEHCAKCGTHNHITSECHLTEEQAKAGLDLHAKLTNFDKASKNCPQCKERMDHARTLKCKPSTSGIFGPDKFGCPSCHRQGKGDHEDHWLKDCPNCRADTSSAEGGHGGNKKRKTNNGNVFATSPETKNGGKKKKRRKKSGKKSGNKTVTFTMTKEAAAALGSGKKQTVKDVAAFSKQACNHDADDEPADSDDSD